MSESSIIRALRAAVCFLTRSHSITSFDFQWISGHVFLDLEFQELVNCLQSLRVAGGDLNQSAASSFLVFVADFFLELLHDLGSRWRLLVNQHGNLKVPLAEHRCDVPQMTTDLIATGGIFGIVRFNLNRTAIICQEKVMGRFQMVESHVLIASHVHLVHLLLRHMAVALSLLLGADKQRRRKADRK